MTTKRAFGRRPECSALVTALRSCEQLRAACPKSSNRRTFAPSSQSRAADAQTVGAASAATRLFGGRRTVLHAKRKGISLSAAVVNALRQALDADRQPSDLTT